jgi:aldehyde dehydrogenase (NAD+)
VCNLTAIRIEWLVDETQFNKIMRFISNARDRNVQLATGGCRHRTTGYFIEPTVFTNVNDDDTLACEEIFGPVLSVLKPFKTEAEAVERANRGIFGLAAGLWTQDTDRVHRVTGDLRVGTCWVNWYSFPLRWY